ncbi:hypothetical protein DFJ73DRAFT_861676 [Zopfochytrium polystomum]|nr:hypothetical protein DFJ73DRAFT_861676 [Zopfochytrium polystomum]
MSFSPSSSPARPKGPRQLGASPGSPLAAASSSASITPPTNSSTGGGGSFTAPTAGGVNMVSPPTPNYNGSTLTTTTGVLFSDKIPVPSKLPLQAPIRSQATNPTTDGAPDNAKIRYSGDLELQLGFERNPLDKPSSDFRNAEAWFKNVGTNVEPPPLSHQPSLKRGLFSAQPQGAEMEYNGPANGDSGKRNSSSVFRSSFMFLRNSLMPARRTAADFEGNPDDTLARGAPDRKRPMGPRGMGDSSYPPTMRSPNFGSAAVAIPMPPFYRQHRFFAYLALLFFSAAALVAAVRETALNSSSTGYFLLLVGALSSLAALASLALYAWLGKRLFNYYDAPFLFCQDIPTARAIPNLDNEAFSSSASDDNGGEEYRSGNRLKTLGRTLGAPLQRERPSPWVPLFDVLSHTVLLIFWAAALADGSTKRASCLSNALANYCNTLTVALIFGALAATVVVVATGFKIYEMWRFGVFRSVVKRRIVR